MAEWILGQGTIYPDTIESGGTARADVIKTHHNRVAGIQKLIETGRIIEPLASFYKDEVREIGAELGIPDEFLHRHPFPGPGLAIRCLCSETEAPVQRLDPGWLLPVRSVGVQGDSRSYRSVLALEQLPTDELATTLVNRKWETINRVVGVVSVNEAQSPEMRSTARHPELRTVNPPAPSRRHRSPAFGRERIRARSLAVPRGPNSARHRRRAGFDSSAPHPFRRRNDCPSSANARANC